MTAFAKQPNDYVAIILPSLPDHASISELLAYLQANYLARAVEVDTQPGHTGRLSTAFIIEFVSR